MFKFERIGALYFLFYLLSGTNLGIVGLPCFLLSIHTFWQSPGHHSTFDKFIRILSVLAADMMLLFIQTSACLWSFISVAKPWFGDAS